MSLVSVLDYVKHRFQDRAREKGLELSFEAEDIGDMAGDELYLKRLLSNLTDNALKFTDTGGWVRFRLVQDGKQARIDISDNGMGMELDVQEKVFDRFYRTDQARSHEGAGLGLNIARAIALAHQGSLKIKSQPGQGTTVTLFLPLP